MSVLPPCLLVMLVALSSMSAADTASPPGLLDRTVDWALSLYQSRRTGSWLIPISGFRKPFVQGLISGEVSATGGYFGDLGSLRRLGPVKLGMNGTKFRITADFALTDFRVGYKNYTMTVGESSGSGEVQLEVLENRLGVRAELDMFRPFCPLSVSLGLSDVIGPQIQVQRLGDFTNVMGLLTDWAVNVFARRLVLRANVGLQALAHTISPECSHSLSTHTTNVLIS